jgi:hypothetical protein
MWQAAQWVCALVAMSCGGAPSVAVIQSAYDREAGASSKPHDTTLQVLQAKCHDNGTDKYRCEVTFISKSDPTARRFFDIVAVDRVADGWELKSGLCKR